MIVLKYDPGSGFQPIFVRGQVHPTARSECFCKLIVNHFQISRRPEVSAPCDFGNRPNPSINFRDSLLGRGVSPPAACPGTPGWYTLRCLAKLDPIRVWRFFPLQLPPSVSCRLPQEIPSQRGLEIVNSFSNTKYQGPETLAAPQRPVASVGPQLSIMQVSQLGGLATFGPLRFSCESVLIRSGRRFDRPPQNGNPPPTRTARSHGSQ